VSGGADEWSHHATWPHDPSSVSKARRYVTERLTEHGETAVLDAARLVVSELVTNAVRHARVDFDLVLARVGDQVLVQVRDTAPGRPQVQRKSLDSVDGRGLALVEMVSSDWGVTDAGDGSKWVWAVLDLPR
jgi:anti-sigma regulatory factor (Ser/Thr protein kinase)